MLGVRGRATSLRVADGRPDRGEAAGAGGLRTRALEVAGSGPPLVLLHGCDSADTWRPLLDVLARVRRSAGFARSSRPSLGVWFGGAGEWGGVQGGVLGGGAGMSRAAAALRQHAGELVDIGARCPRCRHRRAGRRRPRYGDLEAHEIAKPAVLLGPPLAFGASPSAAAGAGPRPRTPARRPIP